eukprot:CAMPEP_0203788506 /NCGR_PEP_ID=MMETSP0100_2-20121128/2887_1 /ASSEMBLY_ACC=CAM_ASM_000210 /TAXON_ID=96639 /ORGANISM=" , Strain NY0313808BC1" /LENGTH=245 /DNA_ID=CAMNT_0050691261 /DNA_START=722 /DNA_END=1456 /DNA_ORIENTATION=-
MDTQLQEHLTSIVLNPYDQGSRDVSGRLQSETESFVKQFNIWNVSKNIETFCKRKRAGETKDSAKRRKQHGTSASRDKAKPKKKTSIAYHRMVVKLDEMALIPKGRVVSSGFKTRRRNTNMNATRPVAHPAPKQPAKDMFCALLNDPRTEVELARAPGLKSKLRPKVGGRVVQPVATRPASRVEQTMFVGTCKPSPVVELPTRPRSARPGRIEQRKHVHRVRSAHVREMSSHIDIERIDMPRQEF